MHIPPFPVPQGRQERVDGGRQLWMTPLYLPFLGRFSFLIDKTIFIQSILKNSKGEISLGFIWERTYKKKQKKTQSRAM